MPSGHLRENQSNSDIPNFSINVILEKRYTYTEQV